jgi:hypothetical protein
MPEIHERPNWKRLSFESFLIFFFSCKDMTSVKRPDIPDHFAVGELHIRLETDEAKFGKVNTIRVTTERVCGFLV